MFRLAAVTLSILVLESTSTISSLWNSDCFVTTDVCPNENVTFWLYKKNNPHVPIKVDPLNLSENLFTPKRKIVILIHGYTGDRDYSPNSHIRPPLLEYEDVHVVSVDYGPLAKSPCYIQALQNLKTVAKCIAQLLGNLLEGICDKKDIHIIGFSLGAQAAGLVANYMKVKLARITGLDPAKPGFTTPFKSDRLDSSDADFVDVIHTDGLTRGIYSAIGHVDFYPNGGLNQPGCWTQNQTSWSSCNHDTAPFFYGRSLYKKFIATKCSNWNLFKRGFCEGNEKTLMGYYVDESQRGSFYLTADDSYEWELIE